MLQAANSGYASIEWRQRMNTFWEKENAERDRRIQIPGLWERAQEKMAEDQGRHLPMGYWRSLDRCLAEAESDVGKEQFSTAQIESDLRSQIRNESLAEARRNLARKGGRSPKPNRVQELIRGQLTANRDQNWKQILDSLRKRGEIDVDSEDSPDGERYIHFTDKRGVRKTMRRSAFKYRVLRVKTIVSRTS